MKAVAVILTFIVVLASVLVLEFSGPVVNKTGEACLISKVSLDDLGKKRVDWVRCADASLPIGRTTKLSEVTADIGQPVRCDLELHYGRFDGMPLYNFDKIHACRKA